MTWLRNFGYVIASAALLIILTLILFPIHIGDEKISGKTTACISNLKQLSTSLIMYMSDYDERMPNAKSWCDSINEYKRPNATLSCTALPSSWEAVQMPDSDGLGFSMNAFLSAVDTRRFEEQADTYMLYESSTIGKNVSEFFPRLPVPSRHQGKYVVTFLDGHARTFPGAP